MTTATDTRESLSAALKTSTAEAHDKAEHSVFMDDLLAGKLSVADFIALQEQSWLFYSALEDAARAVADHPLASGIVDPASMTSKRPRMWLACSRTTTCVTWVTCPAARLSAA